MPSASGRSGRQRGLGAYALVGLIQVGALTLGVRSISVPAQCLLMPVLAVVPATMPRSRTRTWTLAALTASFLGDLLPQVLPEPLRLPVLLGCFALAQICWIVTFAVRRGRAGPLAALAWAGPVLWLAWRCLPGAGPLAPAVLAYAALLLGMVTAAASWGWRGILGGGLFLVSDGLIALGVFAGWDFAGREVAVMATYILAQGLLVTAALTGSKPDPGP